MATSVRVMLSLSLTSAVVREGRGGEGRGGEGRGGEGRGGEGRGGEGRGGEGRGGEGRSNFIEQYEGMLNSLHAH